VLGWMILMHAGALAAPFFFTWQALGVAVGLHWLTASLGICLTYHRYLSHRSLKIRQPVEFFMVLCGVLSGEGGPLMWSAVHRLHHKRSDQEGDPHSPLDGPWWSHITWLFLRRTPEATALLYERFIPELCKRPMLRYFDRTFNYWILASGAALFLVGGWPMLLWGLCVRMVVAYHSTWFVNSATHLWGYRNYATRDESRNLWWVAILSYGEGWHNNHHAHPSSARAGHRWWEIDMTFWVIRALRACGMAYHVKDRIPQEATKPAPSAVAVPVLAEEAV
jgi:stearoyl-CoA desaturase (delta-9 desaturase)